MKMKEESEKAGLKLNIPKIKIMASCPITLWQIDGETMQTVTDFIFMAAVTICSDSEAQENKVCHCFHLPPNYLPGRDGTGFCWWR